VVRINLSVALFAMAVGLSYPLFTLILQRQGIGATLVGANAAMTPLGSIIAAWVAPRFAARLGLLRCALLCPALAAIAIAYMGAWQNVWLWFPARLVIGLATGGFYIMTRACSHQLAAGTQRGRMIALYATVLSAGYALGPFGIALTAAEGWTPFILGMAVLLAATAVLLTGARGMPALAAGPKTSLSQFIPGVPVLLFAAMAFGFFDRATQALLPAYGLHYGLGDRAMAVALGVFNAGNVVLQFPIGWLADRTPRRYVLTGCALATAVGCVALPGVVTTPFLWAALFVWGALAFGIATVSHAALGDYFSGHRLLAGTAALSVASGLGAIVGPPIVGSAIDASGPDGLPLSLALCTGLLAVLSGFSPLVNVPGERVERRGPAQAEGVA
jgi:MFS family permease